MILTGLPENLTWTVSEQEDPAYASAQSVQTGKIERLKTAEAAFTNVFKTGGLTITKNVDGNPEYFAQNFDFVIELDQPLNGQYGDLNFVDGKAQFQLSHQRSVQIQDLPAGMNYVVREVRANQDGYSTVQTNAQGMVVADENLQVLFTNKKWTGGLEISKIVTGRGADHQKTFTFTIQLSDRTIQGKYGEVEFNNGAATFTLRDQETVRMTDLPENVHYTIEEQEDSAYQSASTGETGTIERTKTANASFINTFKTGSLTVTKTVEGNEEYKDAEFRFSITLDQALSGEYGDLTFENGQSAFTLKNGQSKTILDLPAGVNYEVIELDANQNGYSTTAQSAKGVIAYQTTRNASFINAKSTGDLTISKTIEGNPEYKADRFTFEVVLPGFTGEFDGLNFVDGKAQFELDHNEKLTIHAIPSGTHYEVRELEANQNGYTTVSENENGTIEEAKTSAAAFSNTKWTGDLKISKTVEGKGADENKLFTFDVELSDPTISGTYGDANFTNGKATVLASATQPVIITGLPETITWTVSEQSDSAYRAVETIQSGAIGRTSQTEAAFTNIFRTGSLTISDLHKGNSKDLNQPFHFVLKLDQPLNGEYGDLPLVDGQAQFTLNHQESITLNDLPAGVSYVIEEEQPIAFGWTSSSTNTASIIMDQTQSQAQFVHEKWVGSLEVEKQVTGTGADPDETFVFSIVLDTPQVNGLYSGIEFHEGKAQVMLKAGQTVHIDELPVQAQYEVSEAQNAAFDSKAQNASGIIATDQTEKALFINHFKTGGLMITNTVKGNPEYLDEVFTFEMLLDQPLSGKYGDLIFKEGKAAFTLKNGESATVENLPAGIQYEIRELDGEEKGYAVQTPENAFGEIKWNGSDEIPFENTKWTGDLKFTQTTEGRGADLDLPFVFDLEFTGVKDGIYGDVKIEKGKATVSLKHAESALLKGLPKDAAYTITVRDQNNYAQTPKSVSGTIEAQKQLQEDFVARYLTGGIVISHEAKGNPKYLEGSFIYQVQTDPSINGTYGDLTFENGLAQFEAKEEGMAVLEELPAGLPLSVELIQTPNEGWTTKVSSDNDLVPGTKVDLLTPSQDIAHADFRNEKWTGTLIVENQAYGNSIDPDQDYYFEIRLDDPTYEGILDGVQIYGGIGQFTLKANERKIFEDLPAQMGFEVDEIYPDTRYTVVVEREDHPQTRALSTRDLPAAGSIQAMNEHLVRIIHTFDQYGDVEISNRILGSAADPNQKIEFVMTLDDPELSGTYGDLVFEQGQATFTLSDEQTVLVKNLPYGIGYRIEEKVPEGYLMSCEGDQDRVMNPMQKAAFTNRKDLQEPSTPPGEDPNHPTGNDKNTGSSSNDSKDEKKNVHTGASSDWTSWLTLLVLSLMGLFGLIKTRKQPE